MKRSRISSLAAGLLAAFATTLPLRAEPDKSEAPDFKEVYDLIRQHLPGVNEADLNRAAVQGLISSLSPKVSILEEGASTAAARGALVSHTNLFDRQILYLRVGRVADGLAKAVQDACGQANATNDLNGVILDLRFAGGEDYAAAAATADLFLQKERPLLDWGQGVVQSKEKADAIAAPVAVTVNQETKGAAEVLAAVLRQTGAGLILGSRTAGQAMIAQEYPLKGGQRLRIASSPIHLGDGSDLSGNGVKPDINIVVALQAERNFFYTEALKDSPRTNSLNAFSLLATNKVASTNKVRRPRFNEAELVRERKEGYNAALDSADSPDVDADKGVIRDPVLTRALDVLKGLAVVRRSHS